MAGFCPGWGRRNAFRENMVPVIESVLKYQTVEDKVVRENAAQLCCEWRDVWEQKTAHLSSHAETNCRGLRASPLVLLRLVACWVFWVGQCPSPHMIQPLYNGRGMRAFYGHPAIYADSTDFGHHHITWEQ